ncbi:MAG: molybdopterin-guanine dinucleotide biosynthesis protein B [Anaerotruncus sp.]|nr:molybdopterin-guanine dinucleotide biosynthesis protein B [Anaerotruncus sp.]
MSCILAISGVKNSGKTTVMSALIRELRQRGLRVGAIKHDGHGFEGDRPDTDSWRHKQAGAELSAVFSGERLSLVMDTRDASVEWLLPFCTQLDLVLLEGFKDSGYPKIEVVRGAVSDKPVCDRKNLLAVVSDLPLKLAEVPLLHFGETARLADLVEAFIQKFGC